MISVEHLVTPDDPQTLRDFVSYWASCRNGGIMPSFSEIDPVDIPWALPQIYILRVIAGGDFSYRLAGEGIAQRYNRSLKGVRISELFTEGSAHEILGRWRRVVSEPAGYYSYAQHATSRGSIVRSRRVILPLGADGQNPDHVIGLSVFEDLSVSRDTFLDDMITHSVRWADLRL